MTNLIIEATKKNPSVDFRAEGKLLISGNSLGNDHVEFYDELKKWCNENLSKNVEFNIDIPYMNTGSSQSLNGLVKEVYGNSNIESLTINWHYEEEDVDMQEYGELLEQNMPNAKFLYTVKECV